MKMVALFRTAPQIALLVGLPLAAGPGLAQAQAPHVLATSRAQKLQVVAEGGEAWCQSVLHLRMVLETDSPDAGNAQAQLAVMNLLKATLLRDCANAQTAELTVAGPGAAPGVFAASAAEGWTFHPSPATPAPAPAPAPAPSPAAPARSEAQRQAIAAQRDQAIKLLAAAPVDVRLANFITSGQLGAGLHLSDLRSSRAAALLSGTSQTVRMLVQADASGLEHIDTRFPGHLQLSAKPGLAGFKSGGWYLVEGALSVPDGAGLPAAQLAVTSLYACTQDQCADATDATTIVDRKLAALGLR